MLFGKIINKYYLRYLHYFIFGILALIMVDASSLEIPKLYNYLINGINEGAVEINGSKVPFDFNFVLTQICENNKSVELLKDNTLIP
jgi:ATP-binding cassette subfamily B protein